jgi:DNA-binding transcriptional LysR family regulator
MSGALEEVLTQYDVDPDSAIWAVYPSNRHVLPKLRVFLEFMSDWYKDCRRPLAGCAGFDAAHSDALS